MIRKIRIISCIIVVLCLALALSGCSATLTGNTVLSEAVFDCSISTDIEIFTINDVPQACYRDNGVYFTVDNMGSSYIEGLTVTIDAEYDLTMDLLEPIRAGGVAEYGLSSGTQKLTNVDSMIIRPIIDSGRGSIVCDAASIKVDLKRC